MTGPPFFSLMSPGFVWTTDRRARVWRMRNERFAEVCIAEYDRYGGGSVMVWAGISTRGKTDLHVIDNGTLMAERYVNEILDVHVRPYADAIGPDFILMDDNARAHRARITNRYLEQVQLRDFSTLTFHPPYSRINEHLLGHYFIIAPACSRVRYRHLIFCLSVRPSVHPSVRLSTFMSTFDIYVKVSILIN